MNRSRNYVPPVVPILSAGRHRNPRRGACFMEFASYLAGERWSDHPACTDPLLAVLARDVNDLVTDDARQGLTPLIHRVVGLTSDDPSLNALIAVHAASAALPVASQERQRALAVGMLNLLSFGITTSALRTMAADAFAQAPGCEAWARHHIATNALPREFGFRAAEAIVHTSVVGIALACVPDADARLIELLRTTIDATETLARPTPLTRRALQRA